MFLKHIGKHGDRKVCILFREVPDEAHMSLVIYPQVLPAPWHDSIMKVLESDVGQQAEQFADALHRSLLPDGRVILETLHAEKMIKKIRASDIQVTPRTGTSIRLDELNKMLADMKTGDDAIKKLAATDSSLGIVAPEVKRAAEAEFKKNRVASATATDGALSNAALASNMLNQAEKMEAEGKGLLSEAARMKKDAERLHPGVRVLTESDKTLVKVKGRPPGAGKKIATVA